MTKSNKEILQDIRASQQLVKNELLNENKNQQALINLVDEALLVDYTTEIIETLKKQFSTWNSFEHGGKAAVLLFEWGYTNTYAFSYVFERVEYDSPGPIGFSSYNFLDFVSEDDFGFSTDKIMNIGKEENHSTLFFDYKILTVAEMVHRAFVELARLPLNKQLLDSIDGAKIFVMQHDRWPVFVYNFIKS